MLNSLSPTLVYYLAAILLLTAGCSKPKEVVLDTGLIIVDNAIGEGTEAAQFDIITVHYVGMLEDGTVFDSSRKPGREPLRFTLGIGQVIQGWDDGIPGMKIGGKRTLTIPPELGYGVRGAGDAIPPNATLIFEVELLVVEKY